jgi:hypothetical protein
MADCSRRTFLAAGSTCCLVPPVTASAASAAVLVRMEGGLPASFPAQDPTVVREVVLLAHTNLEGVGAHLSKRPELAKATWDWGFGDWESALGAASHMGRADIAEMLIAHGARPDLFTFAMLGQVDVVRSICQSNPGIQRLHGPHGITLLRHAINGGEAAASVVAYLEELGDADIGQTDLGLDARGAAPYLGEYIPRHAPDVVLGVGFHDRRKVLTLQRDDQAPRFLLRQGEGEFAVNGAASVRIGFLVDGDHATACVVRDGDLHLTAHRR